MRFSLNLAALLSLLVIPLAGCGEVEDPETIKVEASAPESEKQAAVAAIDNSPYHYVPRKKRAPADAVKPIVKQDNIRVALPKDAKRPEIIAHLKQYDDQSVVYNGPYTEFSSDGTTKHSEGAFRDNRRNGPWKYYHANGQIAKEIVYDDGKLNGKWMVFNEDGSKKYEASFKKGQRDGMWTYYSKADAEGKQYVLTTEEFKDNARDGKFIQFHANGQKGREITFDKNKVNGKELRWYPSGKPYSEVSYKDGLPHGKLILWDEAGKVVAEREYRDGKPLGAPTVAKKAAKT